MRSRSLRGAMLGLAILAAIGAPGCDTALGIGDLRFGVCLKGEVRCAGATPEACDAEGQWQPGAKCPFLCQDGQCRGVCAPNGAACDDGDACTRSDTCQDGACVGSNPILCPDVAGLCAGGKCDPATGACGEPDGASCDDGDACTTATICQGGSCNPEGDHASAHWSLTAPPPAPRFVTTADVVVDRQTGLTWQREVTGSKSAWIDAISHCASLALPGYPSGWRLPTRIELASLVDYAGSSFLDPTAFPNAPVDYFWTASPYAFTVGYAWNINFASGFIGFDVVKFGSFARCVH